MHKPTNTDDDYSNSESKPRQTSLLMFFILVGRFFCTIAFTWEDSLIYKILLVSKTLSSMLGGYFVWRERCAEVQIYEVSLVIVNSLGGCSGLGRNRVKMLVTRNSREELCGWTSQTRNYEDILSHVNVYQWASITKEALNQVGKMMCSADIIQPHFLAIPQ